jgi:hypothetical protein
VVSTGAEAKVRVLPNIFCDQVVAAVDPEGNRQGEIGLACLRGGELSLGSLSVE